MTFVFNEGNHKKIGRLFYSGIAGRLEAGEIDCNSGNIAWIYGIRSSNPNSKGEFEYNSHSVGADPGDKIKNAYHKGRIVARTGMPSGLVVVKFPELLQDEDFPWQGAVLIGKDLISAVAGCTPCQDEFLATYFGTFANSLRQTAARKAVSVARMSEGRDRFVRGPNAYASPAAVSTRDTPLGQIAFTGSPRPSERVREEGAVS